MEVCSIWDCPAEDEERAVLHLKRWSGQPVVLDHVPARVYTISGDTLFTLVTVERLETLHQATPERTGAMPLFEYEVSAIRPPLAPARNTIR